MASEDVDHDIMLHSLRLIGNACADTGKLSFSIKCYESIAADRDVDDNRQRVIDLNYTLPIIKLFLDPALVHVAIPVIYNICTDFGGCSLPLSSVLLTPVKDMTLTRNRTCSVASSYQRGGLYAFKTPF